LNPRLIPTGCPGDATFLARRSILEGADLILVLGGDGTINETVNGMIGSNVPLGVLPGGTANVLAMELGLGSKLERAIGRLGRCVERRVALARLTDGSGAVRHFLMMAGAGLDARIVCDLNAALKARTGKLAYWMAGLLQIRRRVGQLDMRVNGSVMRCGFALAARVRNYGGDLEIASGASLLNDDFEIVVFEGSNPLRYMWYMVGVGMRQVQKMPGVHTIRANRVILEGDGPIQIDGEYAGQLPATLDIVPGALTLLMPDSYL
jgi:YegS/Rv2252/BmrU family lipid kinase